MERTYRDLLLGNHVPHDKFRAVPGTLVGITSKKYGDLMSNLLNLARQVPRSYVRVQIDTRRERLTDSVGAGLQEQTCTLE